MLQSIAIILIIVVSFLMGVFTLFGYMLWRMMRNEGWDDSNINNAERLLSHVVLHSEDFGKMYYLTEEELAKVQHGYSEAAKREFPLRPFWYVDKDEFSEVVQTRPLN